MPQEPDSVIDYGVTEGEGVSRSGDPLIDGILGGGRWVDFEVSYSFTDSRSDYDGSNVREGSLFSRFVNAFEAFSEEEAAQIRLALQQYEDVSGLSFVELDGEEGALDEDQEATMRFAQMEHEDIYGFGGFPAWNTEDAGQVWLNEQFSDFSQGSYGYYLALHEIGHSIGMRHSFDATFGELDEAYDTIEYTVMTYDFRLEDDAGFMQSLMAIDIAATQYLYGANFEYNAGDTEYTFDTTTGEMFVDGVGQGTPHDNVIFRTIWDGNGTDHYNFSNYTTDMTIDLAPGNAVDVDTAGNFQSVEIPSGNMDQVYNAWQFEGDTRSLIENATGGSGSDMISGNQADNVLAGGAGNDTLYGIDGDDTLIGGAGDDALHGGDGTDVAYFGLSASGYTVTIVGDNLQIDGEGIDTVFDDIEFLDFSGYTLSFLDIFDSGGLFFVPGPVENSGEIGLWITDDGFYELVNGDTRISVLDGAEGVGPLSYSGVNAIQAEPVGDGYQMLWETSDGAYQVSSVGADGQIGPLTDLDDVAGAETLYSLDLNGDFIVGDGSGDDIVQGTDGDDTLLGYVGDDELSGGEGEDSLDGGVGDDLLSGGEGEDTLLGGDGNDTLEGGQGNTQTISDNLLTNGSFEDGTHSAGSVDGLDGWSDFRVGRPYSGGNAAYDDGTNTEDNFDYNASDGTGYLLSYSFPDGPRGGFSQELQAPLEAGAEHTLTFDATSADWSRYLGEFRPSDIPVRFEILDATTGEVLASTIVQSTDYEQYTITFTPTTAISTIAFRPNYAGTGTYPAVVVDNLVLVTEAEAPTGDQIDGGAGDDDILILDDFGNDTIIGGDTGEVRGDLLDASAHSGGITLVATGDGAGVISDETSSAEYAGIELFTLSDADDTADLSATTSGVVVDAGAGDDSILGGAGDDSLTGGAGDDTLNGGAGADTLVIGSGDIADGGEGADRIIIEAAGGTANVTVNGGALGVDRDILDLSDFASATLVSSEADSDGNGLNGVYTVTTDAGESFDVLFNNIEEVILPDGDGGGGDVEGIELIGTPEDDMLVGDLGDDTIDGLAGDDSLEGGAGNDALTGGAGDDTLRGGYGDDTLLGGDGNDEIEGLFGNDQIDAGAGNDHVFGRDGDDVIYGREGNDTLVGSIGTDTVYGGEGDDLLAGSQGNDEIHGGAGNDLVFIGVDEDSDRIYLDEGDDFLDGTVADSGFYGEGGSGNDQLVGGTANDTLLGNADDDILSGGTGDDSLDGGAGIDVLTGGVGNDEIHLGEDDGADDTVVFGNDDGADLVHDFEAPTDLGDGRYQGHDLLDVSDMTNSDGDPISTADVTVTEVDGNATLTFATGEVLTLVGVSASLISTPAQLAALGIPLADDGSGGTGLTYTLDGPDTAYFEVDPDTGDLSFVSWFTPNHEEVWDANGDLVYEVSVIGLNADGTEESRSDQELVVNEDDSFVWREAGEGGGGGDAPSFALDGPDAGYFEVDPDTGDLSFVNWFTPNYEQVWDANGDLVYEVTVVGLNPDGTEASRDDQELVVNEDDSFVWRDAGDGGGGGDAPSFTLDGPDAGYFEVDPDTGDLSFVDWFTPNYEQVWDANGDLVYEVSVVGLNPDGTEASRDDQELVVNEDNSFVWRDAGDDGGEDGPGFALDGPDAGYFEVDPETGELSFINWFTPNHEEIWDANGDLVYEVSVVSLNPDGTEASRTDQELVVNADDSYIWRVAEDDGGDGDSEDAGVTDPAVLSGPPQSEQAEPETTETEAESPRATLETPGYRMCMCGRHLVPDENANQQVASEEDTAADTSGAGVLGAMSTSDASDPADQSNDPLTADDSVPASGETTDPQTEEMVPSAEDILAMLFTVDIDDYVVPADEDEEIDDLMEA